MNSHLGQGQLEWTLPLYQEHVHAAGDVMHACMHGSSSFYIAMWLCYDKSAIGVHWQCGSVLVLFCPFLI